MAEYKSDIEIARAANKKPILEIGAKLGIPSDHLLPYGHDKAKVSADFIASLNGRPDGKLILVTAINPTPAGTTGWSDVQPAIAAFTWTMSTFSRCLIRRPEIPIPSNR